MSRSGFPNGRKSVNGMPREPQTDPEYVGNVTLALGDKGITATVTTERASQGVLIKAESTRSIKINYALAKKAGLEVDELVALSRLECCLQDSSKAGAAIFAITLAVANYALFQHNGSDLSNYSVSDCLVGLVALYHNAIQLEKVFSPDPFAELRDIEPAVFISALTKTQQYMLKYPDVRAPDIEALMQRARDEKLTHR